MKKSANGAFVSEKLFIFAAVLICMAYEKGIYHYDDGSDEPRRSGARAISV
jgi:hypothetical protein